MSFFTDAHVCTIWKVTEINKEKEICLQNKEYVCVIIDEKE